MVLLLSFFVILVDLVMLVLVMMLLGGVLDLLVWKKIVWGVV